MARQTRNRKGEGERLRGQLLQAASKLLAEAGDSRHVSIRAVAEAAGVTSPSVYRHFPSKQDLVREVLAVRFGEFQRTLEGATAGVGEPADRLRHACHAYVLFGLSNPGDYRLLFSTAGLGPASAGLQDEEPHPGAASLANLLELVVERVGPGHQASSLAFELWASLHGIVDLRITKPEMEWPPPDGMIQHALGAIDMAATSGGS